MKSKASFAPIFCLRSYSAVFFLKKNVLIDNLLWRFWRGQGENISKILCYTQKAQTCYHRFCYPSGRKISGYARSFFMNKEEKCVWKVALRLNLLTKDDPNDCIAEVVPPGATKHNIDIAREILKRGSEFRLETITSILDQRDAAVLDAIEHGYSFADNLVQALPRVTGVWKSLDAGFDAAVHKRTVDLVPTQALRDALEKVSVVSSGLSERHCDGKERRHDYCRR